MRKIKTAVAAFGMSGKVFHALLIDTHPSFELTAICERSKNEAEHLYPAAKIVKSFDELLAISEIELVIINTPDTTHYEYCKRALLANKHVVVEKPFVFTVAEGEELVTIARERNRRLAVFQNRRWDGDFITIQKILSENSLGRVVEFQSTMPRFRNFIAPNTWKEQPTQHVGLTYNLGPHLIDQAVVLFGFPDAVFARIEKLRDGSQIDDYFQIQLFYPKLEVTLKASYLMREETPRFAIHGTLGSFVKYGLDPQEDALKAGKRPVNKHWGEDKPAKWGVLHTEINGEIVRYPVETEKGNWLAYYDNIAEYILNNAPLLTSAEDNLKLIAILEAAFRSHDENCVVYL
ncbi:MAG: Gfo/Idh/MocA family oxidoreductase [Bacteroidales bacterium]